MARPDDPLSKFCSNGKSKKGNEWAVLIIFACCCLKEEERLPFIHLDPDTENELSNNVQKQFQSTLHVYNGTRRCSMVCLASYDYAFTSTYIPKPHHSTLVNSEQIARVGTAIVALYIEV